MKNLEYTWGIQDRKTKKVTKVSTSRADIRKYAKFGKVVKVKIVVQK